jgi:hypothetical protein
VGIAVLTGAAAGGSIGVLLQAASRAANPLRSM